MEARPPDVALRTRGSGPGSPGGELRIDGPRAELDRGVLLEWLENRPGGLEHGWTITSAPAGEGPLWIGLELEGDLSLEIEEGARSAVLVVGPGAARLRYGDLRAWDATGRELAAVLASSAGNIGIHLDDAGAAYPLTVDPALTCPAWTAEGDQAYAYFGFSVATAGDVDGDGFSDVIVGAYGFDNGQTDEGRAYVYLGSATGLSTTAAWTAESDQANSYFGFSVATAGDVNGDGYDDVIVGAPRYDHGQPDEGRAFVYLGSPTGLMTSPSWTEETNLFYVEFGSSVATAGDVNGDGYSDVIVGEPHFGANGLLEDEEGRAHVYMGSATGLATTPVWTVAGNNCTYDFLGYEIIYCASYGSSVATAGDVNGDGYDDVTVGAPTFQNGQDYEGRAFVYLGSATGLRTTAAWKMEGSDLGVARLGSSVSSVGDINGDGFSDVAVGTGSNAFAYLGSVTGLGATPTWTATGGHSLSGGDVNGDGYDDVIVGADGIDNGQVDEGRAYLYLGSATFLSSTIFEGDDISVDTIVPFNVVIGSSWNAPLAIHHSHGTGGPLSLKVRSATVNGPNFFSPVGGRLTEILIAGTLLGAITGSHDGAAGGIPPQPIPNQPALVGLTWAAQYTVAGGGFADLSQAVHGVVDSCP